MRGVMRLRSLLLAAALAAPLAAQRPTERAFDALIPVRPDGYLTDMARVVPNGARVEEQLRALARRDSLHLVAVTMPTLRGRDPADAAREIGRRWRVALAGTDVASPVRNTGGVILVVMDTRQCRVEVATGSEGYMTDARAAQACRDARQFFREGRFDDGILSVASRFATFHREAVARAAEAAKPRPPEPPKPPFPWGAFWLIALPAFAVAAVLFERGRRRRARERAIREEREQAERLVAVRAEYERRQLQRVEDERRRLEEEERLRKEREAEERRWSALTPEQQAAELAERERQRLERERAAAEQRARDAERHAREAEDRARRQREEDEQRCSSSYGSSSSYDSGGSVGGGSDSFGGGGGGNKW